MITLTTNFGDIEMNLTLAPVSSKNFLKYCQEGYEGTTFHRVIEGFMIQGGGHTIDMTSQHTHLSSIKRNRGLKNVIGSVATGSH